ncbi:Biotin carboxylase [Flexibacter flexilis DSM 6793]|uniref:Biotin carboxylase n=1 Tax=Flexibacter flexilis DSM 6793 TaxID=927664 RepID=A0A1I1G4L4_9BACT|nr:ATP-grasp domain-containing protein [Flexibacter flexilis]SFC06534.1 Biotin carboxylase [Flexibacter flexilis DSM 6793]
MKKLAIIGASYLQLPLVKKAVEMGIETHCFAWAEGAVCKDYASYFYPISILDKEEILKICQQVQIDGITTIASDAAVPTVCFVAQSMGLLSNGYEDALVATDKYKMRRRFEEFGVSSPRFLIASEAYSAAHLRYPLIVKPTDRSGSRGVMKVENPEDLSEAVLRAQKEAFSKQAIIEEYVSGSEVSVEGISWKGKHYILAITDKVTTKEPYFVELEHHQPSLLSPEIQEKIKEQTYKSLSALNIHYGASHAELKITESGEVFVIEVGARMGGDFIGSDLVKLSTGYDFVRGVIEVALGTFEEPVSTFKKSSGVYFLCKETERILPLLQNSTSHQEIVESDISDTELRNIECSADRSGYFIYQSDKRFLV